VTPSTLGGWRYFLLIDVSHYMWAVLLDAKAAAADAIKRLQAAEEAECGRKLRVLRTDNGGEFTAAEFTAYCADEGIHRHFSAPYTPQQNGVSSATTRRWWPSPMPSPSREGCRRSTGVRR
jgi:transposase InsO family protein